MNGLTPNKSLRSGFSLIELMAILLIIGVLSAVAASRATSTSGEAAIRATAQHLQTIGLAAELHYDAEGFWPSDQAGGLIPAQLTPYLRPDLFRNGCPLGGAYDWDRNRFAVTAAVKIVAPKPSQAEMLAIDALIDDGDLATGYVVDSNGFKLIVEQ